MVSVPEAQAAPLIVNGGFESGFTGWSRVDQVGGDGTLSIQSGTSSPSNGDVVPAPTKGANAAMSDAQGPGAHVLYQDFTAVAGVTFLSFDLFIGNRGFIPDFASPDTLDFSIAGFNQQVRVDIIDVLADPFSVGVGDVLQSIYQSQSGDPLISGYTNISADIAALMLAHSGQTLRLRFAETDNLGPLQMGVDDIQSGSGSGNPVPEPSSALLVGAGLALMASRRTRGPGHRHST